MPRQKLRCSNPLDEEDHQSKTGSGLLVRSLGDKLYEKYHKVTPNLSPSIIVCSRCRNEFERRLNGKPKIGKKMPTGHCCNPFKDTSHVGKTLSPITKSYLNLHPSFSDVLELDNFICVKCRGQISKREKKTSKNSETSGVSKSEDQKGKKFQPQSSSGINSTSCMLSSEMEIPVPNTQSFISSNQPSEMEIISSEDASSVPQVLLSLPITSPHDSTLMPSQTKQTPSCSSKSAPTQNSNEEVGPSEVAFQQKLPAHQMSKGMDTDTRFRKTLMLPLYPDLPSNTDCEPTTSHNINESNSEESQSISQRSSMSIELQEMQDTSEFEDSDVEIEKVNKSLTDIGISPIKRKSVTEYKLKYGSMKTTLQKTFSSIAKSTLVLSPSKNKKCTSCSTLTRELKQKFDSAESKEDKYKMLTCVPVSMTIADVQRIFGCSNYMAKKASKLRSTNGAFSAPPRYRGHPLSEETKTEIIEYYRDDSNSRQLPGIRDTIQIRNPDTGVFEPIPKRRMLVTLAELHKEFKTQHLHCKVSMSVFALLKPKECVWAGRRGFHDQCSCVIHQNFDLMMIACGHQKGLQLLLDTIVCDQTSETCMSGVCPQCPIKDETRKIFEKLSEDEYVEYYHWSSTDGTEITCLKETKSVFVEKVNSYIPKILMHHFLVKKQKQFKDDLKNDLKNQPGTVVVILDFAQNYSFLVQDSVQGFHWTHQQATVHPFYLMYYDFIEEMVKHKTYVVISDELKHVTNVVFTFQKRFVEMVKNDFPHVSKIVYMSDGCAGQYKNYKNLLNVMYHQKDFGIKAEWEFFPTAHGKGPSDAASAIVKQSTRLESLRRKLDEPKILTPMDMYRHCEKKLTSFKMKFIYVGKDEVKQVEKMLEERYKKGKTIPGTHSVHSFRPLTTTTAALRMYSSQPTFTCFDLNKGKPKIKYPSVNDYVAVIFGASYQFGLASAVDELEQQIEVTFFKTIPEKSALSWPQHPVKHWVVIDDYICTISEPVATTKTGRAFKVLPQELSRIEKIYKALQK